MKHKIEIAPNLAIFIDGERVIGSKPQGLFLMTEMIVSDEDLKRLADRCLEVISDSKTEPTISKMEQVDEPQKDCYMCKWLGEVNVCGRCRNRNLFCEAEPQPRCPKCGKRGYIRSLESMGVKLKVFDEYKWKCTNCNKYFKEEPTDESQTDCPWK